MPLPRQALKDFVMLKTVVTWGSASVGEIYGSLCAICWFLEHSGITFNQDNSDCLGEIVDHLNKIMDGNPLENIVRYTLV